MFGLSSLPGAPSSESRARLPELSSLALLVSVGAAFALGACKEQPLAKPRADEAGTATDSGATDGTTTSRPKPDGQAPTVPTTRPVPSPANDGGAGKECSSGHALDLYNQKIAPLFADDHPSTCGQCHLAGIDLEMFVRSTPCETLACLVERELVDPSSPEDSKILSWIGRAEPDSELITEQVIKDELAAFEQWISYSIECGTCGGSTCPEADAGVSCTLEPIPGANFEPSKIDPGGCADSALEAVFRETVYANRGRCAPCHFNDHEDEEAPQWIEVAFDCEEASRRTLANVVEGGYLDLDEPAQSLLLLKPLAKDMGGLEHGGGDKFEGLADVGYASFEYFVERYAACAATK